MLGLDTTTVSQLPSQSYTVSLFFSMGVTHALMMNLLKSKSLFHQPLWMAWRAGCGVVAGLFVDNLAPFVKGTRLNTVEYKEKYRAWEEGVIQRRKMELEMFEKLLK